MSEKKYLNEEKYQKTEKTITLVAILVFVVGLCIGGFLLIVKPGTSNIEELKVQLETKKNELESKGVRFSPFTNYSDGEAYDLKIITNALDPSFPYCEYDEYKNNSITKDYCAAKNSHNKEFGVLICVASFIISGIIFMVAKRRHILAFQAQQVMPVAKEGIDEMAPTIGNAAGEIAKGIKKGLNDDEK